MLEAATSDNDAFSVSRIEIDGGMSGYTADTVARLVAQMPDCRFVLILSSESAAHLPEWHEPERLLDLAEICVVPRLGYANLPREWLRCAFSRPRRPLHVRRHLDSGPLVVEHSGAPVRGNVDPLPRPACRRALYRRTWTVWSR